MLSEKSEHEPDEYDPEEEFRDRSSDSITIPEVATAESDAPGELFQSFWILVFVVNAALMAVSIGAMFLVFRGDLRTGGGLLAGGGVLFGLAFLRYRSSELTGESEPSRSASGESVSETVSGPDHEPDVPEDPIRE